MSMLAIAAVSLVSGFLGALGMGAGAVLLIYLRVYAESGQYEAQGINLLFFIPIALLSIVLHSKNKLINWKSTALAVASGLPGVWIGVWAGSVFGTDLLSKLFGGLLLVIGIRELFCGFRPGAKKRSDKAHRQY